MASPPSSPEPRADEGPPSRRSSRHSATAALSIPAAPATPMLDALAVNVARSEASRRRSSAASRPSLGSLGSPGKSRDGTAIYGRVDHNGSGMTVFNFNTFFGDLDSLVESELACQRRRIERRHPELDLDWIDEEDQEGEEAPVRDEGEREGDGEYDEGDSDDESQLPATHRANIRNNITESIEQQRVDWSAVLQAEIDDQRHKITDLEDKLADMTKHAQVMSDRFYDLENDLNHMDLRQLDEIRKRREGKDGPDRATGQMRTGSTAGDQPISSADPADLLERFKNGDNLEPEEWRKVIASYGDQEAHVVYMETVLANLEGDKRQLEEDKARLETNMLHLTSKLEPLEAEAALVRQEAVNLNGRDARFHLIMSHAAVFSEYGWQSERDDVGLVLGTGRGPAGGQPGARPLSTATIIMPTRAGSARDSRFMTPAEVASLGNEMGNEWEEGSYVGGTPTWSLQSRRQSQMTTMTRASQRQSTFSMASPGLSRVPSVASNASSSSAQPLRPMSIASIAEEEAARRKSIVSLSSRAAESYSPTGQAYPASGTASPSTPVPAASPMTPLTTKRWSRVQRAVSRPKSVAFTASPGFGLDSARSPVGQKTALPTRSLTLSLRRGATTRELTFTTRKILEALLKSAHNIGTQTSQVIEREAQIVAERGRLISSPTATDRGKSDDAITTLTAAIEHIRAAIGRDRQHQHQQLASFPTEQRNVAQDECHAIEMVGQIQHLLPQLEKTWADLIRHLIREAIRRSRGGGGGGGDDGDASGRHLLLQQVNKLMDASDQAVSFADEAMSRLLTGGGGGIGLDRKNASVEDRERIDRMRTELDRLQQERQVILTKNKALSNMIEQFESENSLPAGGGDTRDTGSSHGGRDLSADQDYRELIRELERQLAELGDQAESLTAQLRDKVQALEDALLEKDHIILEKERIERSCRELCAALEIPIPVDEAVLGTAVRDIVRAREELASARQICEQLESQQAELTSRHESLTREADEARKALRQNEDSQSLAEIEKKRLKAQLVIQDGRLLDLQTELSHVRKRLQLAKEREAKLRADITKLEEAARRYQSAGAQRSAIQRAEADRTKKLEQDLAATEARIADLEKDKAYLDRRLADVGTEYNECVKPYVTELKAKFRGACNILRRGSIRDDQGWAAGEDGGEGANGGDQDPSEYAFVHVCRLGQDQCPVMQFHFSNYCLSAHTGPLRYPLLHRFLLWPLTSLIHIWSDQFRAWFALGWFLAPLVLYPCALIAWVVRHPIWARSWAACRGGAWAGDQTKKRATEWPRLYMPHRGHWMRIISHLIVLIAMYLSAVISYERIGRRLANKWSNQDLAAGMSADSLIEYWWWVFGVDAGFRVERRPASWLDWVL